MVCANLYNLMKIFSFAYYKDYESNNKFDQMTFEMSNLLIKICKMADKRQKNLIHTALFLFHCQVQIATFHKFDRFIYVCACILVASKLIEITNYHPSLLIRAMRKIIRQKKGMQQKQDDEQKMKILVKKMFQAELIIMINIGFEFDIEIGLFWIREWEIVINNVDLCRKFQENLTELYKTNVVIYFKPEILALAAITMAIKSQDLTYQLSTWNQAILTKLKQQEETIQVAIDYFNSKKRFLIMKY